MPAPCTLCHRQPQNLCQTWNDFGFHDTLLPLALGAASPSNAKACRHVGRKSSPPSVASSPPSPRPRVIECLVHAITASRRRVPKPSDAFQKVLSDFEQDAASDCDSDSSSSSSGSSTGSSGGGGGRRSKRSGATTTSNGVIRKSTSTATAELKKVVAPSSGQAAASSAAAAAAAPAKPRLIRVSRRCAVRRDVSPVDTTSLPAATTTRCRFSLGEGGSSRGRHVRWADEKGAPSDLVTVHLIRPRLRNGTLMPTCFPLKSILKGSAAAAS